MKIIDAHVYVGESLFQQSQSVAAVLKRMDDLEIDQAVLCPNRPKDYALVSANQRVADAVTQHKDRFYGLARIDPWQGEDALQHLKQAREEWGLHGLLLHPWEETFQVADGLIDPLLEYAQSERFPVFIETGYPLVAHPLDIAEIARRFPEVTFIGTHGLQLDSAAFALVDAERAMRECDNLIMETSGMYAPEVMERIVEDLGEHRLMFGSHSPWYNQELELKRAQLLDLNARQKKAVLGGNVARILS
jgi:hypothetical protein